MTLFSGMKLKLVDATDGGTLNTITVSPTGSQTLDQAYKDAVKELERKREGWRTVYPNADFKII